LFQIQKIRFSRGENLLFGLIKWIGILPVCILMTLSLGTVCRSEVRIESDIFPLYACIQPNVKFWLKVYTEYSSDQGVIHDKRRMDRIFGVIPLKDPYRANGKKINKKRIKAAKKKYKAILTKLMKGKPPVGSEEKRVAGQFGPDARAADFRSAMRNLRCQTGQKDRFREGLIRSGAYIEAIKWILREADLPEDLAYLPHVESSFNPKAYSKFGAAGMWQFTRSTGKRFMQVGYTIDERRDPILSSYAAAKLLRQNYRKLNNWPMAITAYNHGVTGMRRALRKKGSYEQIFKEYRSRTFRFASRNFYSGFLAAREAAKNYRQYFGDLKLNAPLSVQEVELSGYVSLPELARYLNLNPAELRELNPALRRPVFRGQKYIPRGYRLRLPATNDRDWQQLMARLPKGLYRQNQKRSTIYKVRRGDTAGKIAKTHGVKLTDLIAVNNLNRRATIYVNQNLRIPLPQEKPILAAKHEIPFKRAPLPVPEPPVRISTESYLKSTDTADPIMRLPTTEESTPKIGDLDNPATHGEAPVGIAGAVPFENPPPANPMIARIPDRAQALEMKPAGDTAMQTPDPDLHQQETATIPESRSRPPRQTTDEPQIKPEIMQGHFAVERLTMHRGKAIGFIRVEPEETLGHYAEWLNVSARRIRRLNGFRYGRPLHLSQQIKIPLDRVSREDFEEKRFEFHQELAEDFFDAYRVETVFTYSIKRGDNIWTLSRQEFEVPLWLLKHYNGDVDFGALVPSQKLLIPIVSKNV
jgi:membrane-bound lytic murein transglycosylase D